MASPGTARTPASVAVLADDLIWGTRLASTVDGFTGFRATRVRALADLEAWLAATDRSHRDAVIVDLTARAYDGVAAVAAAHARQVRVLAVGQHDDVELRRRAIDAGAERVYAYRKLFEDGPATLSRWLGETEPVAQP